VAWDSVARGGKGAYVVGNNSSGGKGKESAHSGGGGGGGYPFHVFHNISEIFFLTARSLHLGVMKSIDQYKQLHRMLARDADKESDQHLKLLRLRHCWDAHLFVPELLQKTLSFYQFAAQWCLWLLGFNFDTQTLPALVQPADVSSLLSPAAAAQAPHPSASRHSSAGVSPAAAGGAMDVDGASPESCSADVNTLDSLPASVMARLEWAALPEYMLEDMVRTGPGRRCGCIPPYTHLSCTSCDAPTHSH
jgi:hypothetical protein